MAKVPIFLRTSWFLAFCFLYFGYSDANITTAQDVGITTTESPTGNFPNPKVILTNLMDQLSNTTFFDLLKKLNSSTQSASQNAQLLKAISRSFRAMNPLSLFTTSVMNNLKRLNLGQCGKDLQMIANETAVMVKCKYNWEFNSLYLRGIVLFVHDWRSTFWGWIEIVAHEMNKKVIQYKLVGLGKLHTARNMLCVAFHLISKPIFSCLLHILTPSSSWRRLSGYLAQLAATNKQIFSSFHTKIMQN